MWNKSSYKRFIAELISNGDNKYKEFTKKLSPTENNMIGISLPILRDYAKKIAKEEPSEFLSCYQGKYFEEKMLFGLVIAYSNDIDIYDKYLWDFSLLINDWSVCDSVSGTLKLVPKNREHFYHLINKLLETSKEYQVRLGIVMLMDHYMCDEYIDDILKWCISIKSDYYYVNMALSWLICECFIKFPDKTRPFIDSAYLSKFVLNKTISKACDSYRVSAIDKENLKAQRV